MPALKLTGIAFQEDRAARLAVINDLPVMEGTMIEGARVMEISEDRVRFNYSGRNFEVLLDGPR
jgi:general secretion pathway protein B